MVRCNKSFISPGALCRVPEARQGDREHLSGRSEPARAGRAEPHGALHQHLLLPPLVIHAVTLNSLLGYWSDWDIIAGFHVMYIVTEDVM